MNGLDLFSEEKIMRGWKGLKRENHPCWKGGRRIDRDGYIRVYRPDHMWPRRGGYILEHVLLMETLLQRRLEKNECVHHKDHNRQNNLPENLEVVIRGAHSKHHRALDSHRFQRDAKGRYVDLPR